MTDARRPRPFGAAAILVIALILALLATLLLAAPTAPQGVSAQQGSPDLVVTKPGVDMRVRPGATFTLAPTVRNIGDAESATTTLRYYSGYTGSEEYGQSIGGLDVEEGTDAIGALSAGGESSQSIELTAPTTLGDAHGHYSYGACVDKVEGEPATTNNCSNRIGVRVTFWPEMTMSASAPERVRPGQSFTLSATLANEGDAVAKKGSGSPKLIVRFYRSEDSTITTSDTNISGAGFDFGREIAAGSSSTNEIDLTASSTPGTYYYGACFVSTLLFEWDTTNNCSEAVAVTVKGYPELTIGGGYEYSPPLVPGGTFTLTTRLENEGDGEAEATTLRAYRSEDITITTSDTELATKEIDAHAPGDITHHNFNLTVPDSPGTYYFGSCVDAVTDESDTTNNCMPYAATLVVPAPAPNLTVWVDSTSDSRPAPGGSFTLSATVWNQGALEASATTLRYYRSTSPWDLDPSSDTEVGADAVGALASGGASAQSIDLTAPSTVGNYYYYACVDTVTDETETEDNCQLSSPVRVTVTNTPATGAPTISGTAQVGQTLTADTSGISEADGLTNVSYSYQWLADDADIDGATSSTYTVQSSDNAKVIKVRVTFTDDAGSDESLTSAGTAAVVMGGL